MKKIQSIQDKYAYSLIVLRELVITDFKLRYQGSALGYVWSLLKPLALFLILYVVFSLFLPIGKSIENFPVYLLIGVVLWMFFSEITNTSVQSIVSRGSLIRKINFPKYIIILSSAVSALINLAINLVVIFIFMLATGVAFNPGLLIIPLLIFELFIFSIGVGFILSSMFVRFRDVNHIWEVIMQGAFYATPIIYPIALIPDIAAKLLILNPVAQIMQDFRFLALGEVSLTVATIYGSWAWYFVPILIVIITFAIGVIVFKFRSNTFAEEV